MMGSRNSKKLVVTALGFWLALTACVLSLVALPGASQAAGQNLETLSRSVVVTSDPPGAVIWMKEGNTLTCTNTLTPGTIELKFHGEGDLKRIRLRKFGYESRDVDIKSGNE